MCRRFPPCRIFRDRVALFVLENSLGQGDVVQENPGNQGQLIKYITLLKLKFLKSKIFYNYEYPS